MVTIVSQIVAQIVAQTALPFVRENVLVCALVHVKMVAEVVALAHQLVLEGVREVAVEDAH